MRLQRFLVLFAIGFCSLAWSADTPTPGFSVVVLENDVARVELTTQRGSIQRFMLKEHHPLDLPKCWHVPGREYPTKAEAKLMPLDVLGPYQTGSEKHNWLYGDNVPNYLTIWDILPSPSATQVIFCTLDPNTKLSYHLKYELTNRPELLCRLFVKNESEKNISPKLNMVVINGVHQDIGRSELRYLTLALHRRDIDGIEKLDYPMEKKNNLSIPKMESVDAVLLKSRFFGAIWRPGTIQIRNPITVSTTNSTILPPEPLKSNSPWNTVANHFLGNRERDPNIAFDPLDTSKNVKPANACRDPQYQVSLETTISDEKTLLVPGGSIDATWGVAVTCLTKNEISQLPIHEQPFEYTDWMHRSLRMLSNALTSLLNWLGPHTGFGVAVIIITVTMKLLLHRLNVKQQRSMLKMQQLSPELKRLKDQCGKDRQQFAMKQMELWKKNGVNPFTGCLPALIQIPIFIALVNTFSYSADMRGHSFLWLRDLTLPDQTFYLGFDLPTLFTNGFWPIGGGPATLNIMPLLYLCASLAMTFTQPQPANLDPDSQQAQMMKIMKWMPILFVCFFYDMSSGVVLYFTAHAILSAVESIYIRKQMAKLKK